METMTVLIAACSFLISIAVGLICYIWIDAKRTITTLVPITHCNLKMLLITNSVERTEAHFCKHKHDNEGNVQVML